jgi:hypothetical protein
MPNPQGEDSAEVLLGGGGAASSVWSLGNVGSGAIALPAAAATGVVKATLTANTAVTFPAPVAGARQRVVLTQDGVGSRLLTLAATSGAVLFPAGTHTLSTASASVDVIDWWSDGVNTFCQLLKAMA